MDGPVNLAQLLVARARERPDARFGVAGQVEPLAAATDRAGAVATALLDAGLRPGACAMVVGDTSTSYLLAWAGLQLAGIEAALVNPTYPSPLLAEMADALAPDCVIWVGREPDRHVAPGRPHLVATDVAGGSLTVEGHRVALPAPAGDLPGLDREPSAIASYMHTSGTTGVPKFCAQSHEYFLRLGRFIADTMGLSPADTVFAPLPMFHVNPLGYGVVASLVAGAGVVGWGRFSARRFWPTVVEHEATALILHLPPVAILKKATTAEDAAGHQVRIAFTGEPRFLERFAIPQGVSGYGSTEAGGLCHAWMWRPGDRVDMPEALTHKVGRSRHDVAWDLDEDTGEILVRDTAGRALFSGYRRGGVVEAALDDDGWFRTGDLGRRDEWGALVFVERMAESIRVKGEFVPIDFVEGHLEDVAGIDELAIWHRPADLADQEVVLYLVGDEVPIQEVRDAVAGLPAFMRPVAAIRVGALPRDAGVGKVQRRRLPEAEVIETVALA